MQLLSGNSRREFDRKKMESKSGRRRLRAKIEARLGVIERIKLYNLQFFPLRMTTAHHDHYNPKATTLHENRLQEFLKTKVIADLDSVPGVGAANKQILHSAGITNTYQLIGKYLSLKASGVKHHQDAMYVWLKSIGVNSGRNNIILALAEKCDVFMHDLYDSRIYA